jgi:hypothetical protein
MIAKLCFAPTALNTEAELRDENSRAARKFNEE